MHRGLVAGLVREIKADAAAETKLTAAIPLGPEAILSQHPHSRPEKLKNSSLPLFHAVNAAEDSAERLIPYIRSTFPGRFIGSYLICYSGS